MNALQLFEQNHIPVTESGCWLWVGGLFSNGYASMPSGKRTGNEGAHRFSYRHFNGEIPHGQFVCHKCDTRTCVNPKHLFLGTHQQNMDDMWGKHRGPEGEVSGRAKLTASQVIAIRADPRTLTQIAGDYGVSLTSIHKVKAMKTWRSVNSPEASH